VLSPKCETITSYEISGYNSSTAEDASLQGCYDMFNGNYIPVDMA
jgi:hypothetical protein